MARKKKERLSDKEIKAYYEDFLSGINDEVDVSLEDVKRIYNRTYEVNEIFADDKLSSKSLVDSIIQGQIWGETPQETEAYINGVSSKTYNYFKRFAEDNTFNDVIRALSDHGVHDFDFLKGLKYNQDFYTEVNTPVGKLEFYTEWSEDDDDSPQQIEDIDIFLDGEQIYDYADDDSIIIDWGDGEDDEDDGGYGPDVIQEDPDIVYKDDIAFNKNKKSSTGKSIYSNTFSDSNGNNVVAGMTNNGRIYYRNAASGKFVSRKSI